MQALVEARGDLPFTDLADLRRARRSAPAQSHAAREPGARRRLRCAGRRTVRGCSLRRSQSCAARRRPRKRRKAARSRCSARRKPAARETLRLPDMPDWPPMERLGFEAEAIGFHLTAHPLDVYAKALRRLGTTACAQVETVAQAGVTRVRLAGTVVAQKERVTRTGNRMAWVRITDASGSCEVTLFAEVSGARARRAGQRFERADHRRPAAGWRGVAGHRAGCRRTGSGRRCRRRCDAHLAARDRRGAAHPRPAGSRRATARGASSWYRASAPRRASRSLCLVASTSPRGWRRR